jgi:pectinesterase
MIHKVLHDKISGMNFETSKFIHYSVQSAVDHSKPGDVIRIQNGCYEEKVRITTSNLTLIGESKESCIVSYGDYALKNHEDGNKFGTFRTYTFLVLAEDVVVQNITIENTSGDGREVGQAIAVYAEGDRLQFKNCDFIGCQDTLFTGPLPPKPMIPGSFVGPTYQREYKQCKQYYEDCMIIGDVDFVFGSAIALFNHCHLVARNRNSDINGYVTAPSTWQGEAYGYVFVDCKFTGEEGIDAGTIFLGRPWRPYGQAMFIGCNYDESFHHKHFDNWGKEENETTARFSEYGCSNENGIIEELNTSKDKSPFIVIRMERKKIDFLYPWHMEMLAPEHYNVRK